MAYCTDIEKAKAFATARHAGVVDKAGEPYTGHLERVASHLLDHPEAAVVAWLHDTAEDTGVSLETIAALFGSDTRKLRTRSLTGRARIIWTMCGGQAVTPSAGW